MTTIGYLAGAAALLYALHRLASWAEDRGWLYYRRRHGRSGSLSSAALEVQALLEPGIRHVLESTRRDDAEDHDSGDPPPSFN